VLLKFRDAKDRETSIISRRLVSMDNPHAAAIEWTFKPENWSGNVTFRSGIDGHIINNNVERYSDLNQDHIEVIDKGHFNDSSVYMLSQSKQSQIHVAQAARTHFFLGHDKIDVEQKIFHEKDLLQAILQ
jgi:trehalose/maltose hydrolase-like predicted phosphorylase